jgi:hypothetical protein
VLTAADDFCSLGEQSVGFLVTTLRCAHLRKSDTRRRA